MQQANDRLAEKYTLPSVSNFTSEIEYSIWDPSEFEEGFGKLFAKAFIRYGYELYPAITSIENAAEEQLEYFAEDLGGQFNDAIDRYIVDPIQKLLPELGDALSGEESD